ncbi:MAG: class I SAM-dependent methyltransferase [Chloroflexi bacterium]|nr:class I SAM-dependent methyltransferase [Chloroflexota bacterium]
MNEYTPSTYGDRIADVYDQMYPRRQDAEAVADLLASLARGCRALELGIGTGRVALPLAARGVEVHGIDASEAMVAQMRAKPGGADIPVTIGDFADVDLEGKFSLIYVVFNTFYGLLTQDEQVRCFRNVAARLANDGVFAIEAFVPDVTRYVRGQNVSASQVDTDRVFLDVTRHDALNQRVTSQHVIITGQGVKLYPVQLRYVWPSEFDLMAQLAGMRLRQRWADWDRSSFTAASGKHVSIFELAP